MTVGLIFHKSERFYAERTAKGVLIFENKGTHAVQVATIGHTGLEGLRRAVAEMDRRAADVQPTPQGPAPIAPYPIPSDGVCLA